MLTVIETKDQPLIITFEKKYQEKPVKRRNLGGKIWKTELILMRRKKLPINKY